MKDEKCLSINLCDRVVKEKKLQVFTFFNSIKEQEKTVTLSDDFGIQMRKLLTDGICGCTRGKLQASQTSYCEALGAKK